MQPTFKGGDVLGDKEYTLYLDESGDHNLVTIDDTYPVFSLAGCVFENEYYQNQVVNEINALKIKYWETIDVIFHYREIRKKLGCFRNLKNPKIRKEFFYDLQAMLLDLDYRIISSVIDKKGLVDQYYFPDSPYDLTFTFIIERFQHFLRKKDSIGSIIIESREETQNNSLRYLYNKILKEGTRYLSGNEIARNIKGLHFVKKKDNIIGCQLADIIAYPIAWYGLNIEKETELFDTIFSSFYTGYVGRPYSYGLKIFPTSC